MEENPYFGLIRAVQSEPEPSPVCEGKVAGLSPLRVLVRGNSISGENLAVSLGFSRDLDAGRILAGDRVLLLTEDDQLYYLICKVVGE